jgi:TfoX/Sxy family transcriptional regulator of competence genes
MVAAFESMAPGGPEAEERQMFGYPAAFVHGHLFMSLHSGGFVVRLAEPDREQLRARGGKPFEPMPGRVMREYTLLPSDVTGDPDALAAWVARAYAFAAALPPKPPKTHRAVAPAKERRVR